MKELVCIVCPRSCKLRVETENGDLSVSGNGCKRGREFALREMTDPRRTLCTTVRTVFPDVPVLPVRLSKEIPKAKIFDVMRAINQTVVTTPVGRNETVIENVLDLGADVIATSNLLKEKTKEGEPA